MPILSICEEVDVEKEFSWDEILEDVDDDDINEIADILMLHNTNKRIVADQIIHLQLDLVKIIKLVGKETVLKTISEME